VKESKIERIIRILSKFLTGKDFFIGRVEKRMIGLKWIYHETNEHDFPSFPHLHSDSDGKAYKLNIYTREIYDTRTKKIISQKISKKEFKTLWSDKSFVDFVIRARKQYLKDNPKTQLPPIPILELKENKNSIVKSDGSIEVQLDFE
jgi:hypothetical protein